jgi:hypothetical protein
MAERPARVLGTKSLCNALVISPDDIERTLHGRRMDFVVIYLGIELIV